MSQVLRPCANQNLSARQERLVNLVCRTKEELLITAKSFDPEFNNPKYNRELQARANSWRNQECAKITASDAFYAFSDAVVAITSATNVAGSSTVYTNGAGFLIRPKEYIDGFKCCDYYVVTLASNVIYPGTDRTPPAPASNGPYIPANTISVQVNNVNGTDVSSLYDMQILIVDLPSNVALLGFKDVPSFSVGKKLVSHPFFVWGKSRTYPVGQEAFVLLPKSLPNTNGFIWTSVTNNHYNPYDNSIKYEGITIFNEIPAFGQGSPIISIFPSCNKVAEVIGIATNSVEGSGIDIAISQYFAQRVVDTYLCGFKGIYGAHLSGGELIDPVGGSFSRYMKGYYGLNLRVYESFDALSNPNLKYPNITGYIVLGFDVNVPPTFSQNLSVNDLIVDINDGEIGFIAPKYSPVAISHISVPGQPITIKYRKYSEGYEKCYCFTTFFLPYPIDQESPSSPYI